MPAQYPMVNYIRSINTTDVVNVTPADQMANDVQFRYPDGSAVTPVVATSKNNVWQGKDDLAAGNSGKRFVPQGAEKLGITYTGRAQTGTSIPSIEWSADGTNFGNAEMFNALTTSDSTQYKVVDVKGRYYRIVNPARTRGVSVNVTPIPDSNY